MKFKEEFKGYKKEYIFDMYTSLVYRWKNYDNISRNKMFDEILKEYEQEKYLYHICTEKELSFLQKFNNKELSIEDIDKYKWEINELNAKGIFSKTNYSVFEEQQDNVQKALNYYKERPNKGECEVAIFIISMVKINGSLLSRALKGMVTSLFGIEEERFNNLLGHPLVHFYCDFDEKWLDSLDDYEEMIYYRKYYDLLEDIDELRMEYGIAGKMECDVRDNFDIFYYGFPIRNLKVKKMYNEILKRMDSDFLFNVVDEVRLLNNRSILEYFIDDENLLEIIDEALDEIPCAIMNGFTPSQYQKEKIREMELNVKFKAIPQNNAHLCKRAADEYYKLYFALLEYVNDKKNISSIKKIYKKYYLEPEKLEPINEYLWNNKKIIDEFIKENKYDFNEEELMIIEGFKLAIYGVFTIVGFEREYTKFLSEDGKIYMVKGVRCDLDKIIDAKELPQIIKTTLLPFKNNIIFNGTLSKTDVVFGNNFKSTVFEDSEKAIIYYHL